MPAWNDHIRWLLRMQHYGTPTRLLDWTESILVALYFAVSGSPGCPGEIWCVRPDALNNRSGFFLSSFDRPSIHYMAAEAFCNEGETKKKEEFAQKLGISTIPRHPIAFLPPLEFPRMLAQSSRFTIHPLPSQENTIEGLLSGPQEIIRYEIPGECKPSLRRDLASLEVTQETLFRSLEALSSTIKTEVYETDAGEGYPSPPVFD